MGVKKEDKKNAFNVFAIMDMILDHLRTPGNDYTDEMSI